MTLEDLEVVAAVCRAGGFTSAAVGLGISQSTLSRMVARIEGELSVRLFDRDGRVVRPTEHALMIAKRVEPILRDVDLLRRELQQAFKGDDAVLRIGVGPATRLRPLPELLPLIQNRYPRLMIETILCDGGGLMEAVHSGRVDLGLGYADCAAGFDDFIRVHLFEDEVVGAVDPRHPLANTHPSPVDLLEFPLATTFLKKGQAWESQLTEAQARNLRAFVSDDFELVRRQPLASAFVAIGPSFLFQEQFRTNELARVKLGAPAGGQYRCWLVATQERWRSPMVKQIAELARHACAPEPIRAAAE